MNSISGVR